jgi:hypothetical protein
MGSDAAAESGATGAVDASDGAVDAGNADAAPFPCQPGDLSGAGDVTPTYVTGNAPSPAGGTLANGRYALSSATFYQGDAAAPDAAPQAGGGRTIEIADGVERTTFKVISDGGTSTAYSLGTISVSGTTKNVTYQCATDPRAVGYTQSTKFSATPTTITTFELTPFGELALEFTQR